MRTKHILTALAIPALFAACVADDFNEAVTGSDMAQRALLSENFKLNFGGADTRFSAGEGNKLEFSYETGDKIGGAIIDEYDPNGKTQEEKFEVVPYVSTNHPFVRNAQGEWTIEHTMVEGNYLFYFPYNENNHARTAPVYSIPVMQDLSGKDGKFDPKAAVEKYSMGVGAQFLDKEDLSASLQLVNIFGYLHLNIVVDNHYPDGTVDKVVLQAPTGEEFTVAGQLSNRKISNLFKILEKDGQTKFDDELDNKLATTDFEILKADEETVEEYREDASFYDGEMARTSSVIVGKAPEGTKLSNIGQGNKGFETYMVIPATKLDREEATTPVNDDVTIYLYTVEGDIYSGKVDMYNFYATRNKTRNLTVEVAKTESVPYVVTSEADWNNNVAMLTRNQNGAKAAEFIIANNNFAITNNTKFPTNGAEIKVTGELKVAGNNVTIKNVIAEDVIVEEGAKLTTDGTFSATNIENNGTVDFAIVYDEEKENEIVEYNGVKNVTNMPGATLNILKDAEIKFYLNNKCDKESAELAHGTLNVNGMLTLDSNNGSVSENDGDIVVAESGSLRGYFTNWDEKKYPENADEEDIEGRYTPTITNNGEIFITTGTAVNYGDIVNSKGAEISCSKTGGSAKFENKAQGSIDVADGSRLLITANEGEVILNKLDQANWKIEGAQGTVAYKTNSADNGKSYDFTATGKGITKLYVTGNLGITKYGDVDDIVVTGDAEDATLALPKDASLEGTLTIEKGANVAVNSEKATLNNLTIEKGATMTVNEDNNMVVNGAINNKGTVYVGGTFNAPNTPKADAGEFRNTSSDSKAIQFKEDQPDTNKIAFETALKGLADAYADNSGQIGTKIKTWSDLKVADIAACGWTDETEWVKAPFKAVTDAYLAWKGHAYTNDYKSVIEFLSDEDYETALNEGITAARTKADAALEATFAELTPERWLGNVVYVKADATAKILNATDNTTELVAGFAGYVKGTAYDSYNKVGSKAIWLSAKSYNDATNKAAEADVPAYSYIHGYAANVEGQHDYEVMKAMKDLAARNFSWFKKGTDGSGTALIATDFVSYEVISEAMALLNNLYNTTGGMSPTERKLVENSKVLDYFDEVMEDWLYTTDSLRKLNELVK